MQNFASSLDSRDRYAIEARKDASVALQEAMRINSELKSLGVDMGLFN